MDIDARLRAWKDRLQNRTDLLLPTDYPRPFPMKVVEAVESLTLSEETLLAVLQLTVGIKLKNEAHPTPFTILLSAFAILLQRYSGDEDFTVGSSSSVQNPLVLRLNVTPQQNFVDVVHTVHQVEREAEAMEVPFDRLLQAFSTQSGAQTEPLFRVRFFDETDAPSQPNLASTSSTTDVTVFITSPHTTSSLKSSFLKDIEVRISYNQILFSPRRIHCILEQLAVILQAAAKDLTKPVGTISLFTPTSKQAGIPDPSKPLHWSLWRGAIHDVFAKNAKSFPDRTCVVESVEDSADKRRIYTYRHIYEASNLVAHRLIRGGVKREDVVMVYAYRGVDLVVTVMGVLKAGCTFSVIDPAYPPKRQNIYLQVAKPRGLIVLGKAGTLDPSVRDYVSTELQIACEIPALQIHPDGKVTGGQVNGADVLDIVQDLASQDPGVVVGPDSVGTLSFTSGSTGIPKGVRGRHFSLTHYYPWMAEEFGLSENDKFTMLSGIAHDPIQRDIFTPLFFGAELHVPTTADIGIPGQLAEWMRNSEVTVTHLTPAMGQLLSSHARNQIPSLQNAFFVGDILTRRDAGRLQKFAENCAVINMYGTTETQRAVSYYRLPPAGANPAFLSSQKEVIPAGKGMDNVQLLVVNRHDPMLMCGVGEVGEIYVRAGGLAEGYLQLPDATAEKFLSNWFMPDNSATSPNIESTVPGEWQQFWKGPRDRVYKSGDLGRYRPDGNVECSGRADDQVKIRGFRIELGEIDTHLSQHPLVRENVTLVRRDKNEEQTLVSYFIPVQGGDDAAGLLSSEVDEEGGDEESKGLKSRRRYTRLIRDIQAWLKQKLPSYAVPTVFVPMVRMPLTPNGKIDKPALPFPDTAQFRDRNGSAKKPSSASDAVLAAMTPTERTVHDIWQSLLPSPPEPTIPLDDNFFDLGGHSLIATRLVFEVRRRCGVDAPLGLVFKEPTIRGLAREVDRLQQGDLLIDDERPEAKGGAAVSEGKGETGSLSNDRKEEEFDYAADLNTLTSLLEKSYFGGNLEATTKQPQPTEKRNVFLTGATGFLGVFILSSLLQDTAVGRVVCLVRASDEASAFGRIRKALANHLLWKDSFATDGRIQVVCGDLGEERLGLSQADWERVCNETDIVIHNGALVHWVYPYAHLRAANVMGTFYAMQIAGSGNRPKSFCFVSSTSVLDTEHYVQLSDSMIQRGSAGVLETDDLEGARTGLRSGYGQSKWVAEKLIMEARSRGLPATIVRPGYILGDSRTGVTNTDDFIWRLVKGCTQLGSIPFINNAVNICAVDYVAGCVTSVALTPESSKLGVFHITHPTVYRFNEMFTSLKRYGYQCDQIEYIQWRNQLMDFTLESQDNALYPLLHFVLDDLPTSTKAPILDFQNTQRIAGTRGVTCPPMNDDLMGIYLAYLVQVGFMDAPAAEAELKLPHLDVGNVQMLKRSAAK
ncbi:hypothetical protein BZG36_01041 [Bifiguratus adelaidae]|uniref:Alpha-aminoadipate reductase n=1 Tax=Bifiguratus adelaidae TaxID=1938954 RepID=A0A261Y6C1_9FUNG|nr:hypothetical protein BZG36_01041 [Bifiguratus adelaidae]